MSVLSDKLRKFNNYVAVVSHKSIPYKQDFVCLNRNSFSTVNSTVSGHRQVRVNFRKKNIFFRMV